ncbi:MAG: hypothetical protein WBA57_16590 [Elainellaceae cyanobacterium]
MPCTLGLEVGFPVFGLVASGSKLSSQAQPSEGVGLSCDIWWRSPWIALDRH